MDTVYSVNTALLWPGFSCINMQIALDYSQYKDAKMIKLYCPEVDLISILNCSVICFITRYSQFLWPQPVEPALRVLKYGILLFKLNVCSHNLTANRKSA